MRPYRCAPYRCARCAAEFDTWDQVLAHLDALPGHHGIGGGGR